MKKNKMIYFFKRKFVIFTFFLVFILILLKLEPIVIQKNIIKYGLSDLDLMNEIIRISDEQFLVDKKFFLKAMEFAFKETNEYDPDLIEFVKSAIHRPSNQPLNLVDKKSRDFSQIGQSVFIDSNLKSMRNGFFIEAGGHDGESHSVL